MNVNQNILEIASLDMPLEQLPREAPQLKCPGVEHQEFYLELITLLPGAATWSDCKDSKVEVRPSFPGSTLDGT